MSNIFFTSDTHYGHANIASEKTSQWKSGWRGYDSVEDMNKDIVRSINQVVDEDDVLYHLGDWSFGGKENIWNFRKQLKVREIHLILGNHDHHIEGNKILPNCHFNSYNDIFDGAPSTPIEQVGARSLFASVSHYKEININGQVYILSHYPFAVWHGNGKGWRHLHGHSHGSFKSIGLSTDAGVDVALKRFREPRPFSLQEVEKIMDGKYIILLDHHGPNTNTGRRPL